MIKNLQVWLGWGKQVDKYDQDADLTMTPS